MKWQNAKQTAMTLLVMPIIPFLLLEVCGTSLLHALTIGTRSTPVLKAGLELGLRQDPQVTWDAAINLRLDPISTLNKSSWNKDLESQFVLSC